MRQDLHMHSDISLDGEFPPGTLAHMCAAAGLEFAALTDHNSVRGEREFALAAKDCGMRTLTGIELDCTCEGVDLHLLGYGIDIEDERFYKIEKEILDQKRESSYKRMEIIRKMGICFEEKTAYRLAKNGIVVGEMIAEAALADERNVCNALLAPYRPGGARAKNPYVNFFWDFCSQGKPAFIPVSYMSFEEALSLIRDTGGVAVIAHPVNTVGRREKMIEYMASCGVAGLEVFSSYHTQEDVLYYRKQAEKLGLFMTGGSDFHGKTKPAVHLGDTCGMQEKEQDQSISSLMDGF